jgi:hypothetical protein
MLWCQITPADELKSWFTHLCDQTDEELIKAKGAVTREATQAAINELLDYRRYLYAKPIAIFAPSRARDDLLHLCSSFVIDVIRLNATGWQRLSVAGPLGHGSTIR